MFTGDPEDRSHRTDAFGERGSRHTLADGLGFRRDEAGSFPQRRGRPLPAIRGCYPTRIAKRQIAPRLQDSLHCDLPAGLRCRSQ